MTSFGTQDSDLMNQPFEEDYSLTIFNQFEDTHIEKKFNKFLQNQQNSLLLFTMALSIAGEFVGLLIYQEVGSYFAFTKMNI